MAAAVTARVETLTAASLLFFPCTALPDKILGNSSIHRPCLQAKILGTYHFNDAFLGRRAWKNCAQRRSFYSNAGTLPVFGPL